MNCQINLILWFSMLAIWKSNWTRANVCLICVIQFWLKFVTFPMYNFCFNRICYLPRGFLVGFYLLCCREFSLCLFWGLKTEFIYSFLFHWYRLDSLFDYSFIPSLIWFRFKLQMIVLFFIYFEILTYYFPLFSSGVWFCSFKWQWYTDVDYCLNLSRLVAFTWELEFCILQIEIDRLTFSWRERRNKGDSILPLILMYFCVGETFLFS